MRKIRSNKSHFFQPLLPDFMYNFAIPKSFLKNFGKSKQDENYEKRAELRDKRWKSWYVKLVKLSGESRPQFKDGWKTFCKDHNLQVGDFLVFKHQGNFVFDVFIFAPTACEREFPVFDPRSMMKTSIPEIKSPSIAKKVKEGDIIKSSNNNPWCCTLVPFYSVAWRAMPLPREFVEKNGLSKRWCDMELIDEKGVSWKMTLRHYRTRINGNAYIGGWNEFYKANGLKIGDAVKFELITNGEKPVMKFYRLKKPNNYNQAYSSGSKVAFKSRGYPHCHTDVKPYSFKWGGFIIPMKFARENELANKRCDITLVDQKGREWQLLLRQHKRGNCVYIWMIRDFYIANHLKAGDPIIFELISSGETPKMNFYKLG